MENEIYNEDSEEIKEDNKKSKVGRIINICLTVALFTFIIAFMFRLCQADHKELEDVIITENFKEAYKISDDIRTHVAGSEFSDNGALYAYSFIYIEEAGYMQITARYNDRHINEVISSLNENEVILNGDNAKTYTKEDIKISYNLSDSKGMEYSVKILATEEKYNYYYFRIEVTDVDFSVDSIYLNMILENVEQTEITENGANKQTLVYKENGTYNAGKLEIHYKDRTYVEYKLSKEEKAQIEE